MPFDAAVGTSPSAFKRGNTLFEGGKPLVEFGGGITAENALAQHGLAEAINAFLEFFLVSIDLVVQQGNLVVEFAVQRPDCAADFSE
jgi:hypothetical protein